MEELGNLQEIEDNLVKEFDKLEKAILTEKKSTFSESYD